MVRRATSTARSRFGLSLTSKNSLRDNHWIGSIVCGKLLRVHTRLGARGSATSRTASKPKPSETNDAITSGCPGRYWPGHVKEGARAWDGLGEGIEEGLCFVIGEVGTTLAVAPGDARALMEGDAGT